MLVIKQIAHHDTIWKARVLVKKTNCLIYQHVRNGTTPSQILSQLQFTGHIEVSYDKVYYN